MIIVAFMAGVIVGMYLMRDRRYPRRWHRPAPPRRAPFRSPVGERVTIDRATGEVVRVEKIRSSRSLRDRA